jgi:Fe(3+) dicitrate transport protein
MDGDKTENIPFITPMLLEYRFTPNTKISAEYTNMDYQMKQSGGLTDAQFEANPQQSFRNRNWFGTPWNVFSIQLDTKINDNLTSNTKLFGLVGDVTVLGLLPHKCCGRNKSDDKQLR